MRHEVVTVTPEVASEWLGRPLAQQRTISRNDVAKYERAMREGRWREPSLDPIAFTEEGLLLNGQHRLAALIKAGMSIEMLIVHDVPGDLFPTIDTGRRRQASQFVRLPNATALASTTRLVLWYHKRRMADPRHPMSPVGPSAVGFDTDEILAFIEGEWGETLQASVHEARMAARYSGVPTSVMGAVLVIARMEGADPLLLEEWIQGLTEGIGLTEDDPRRRLRQRLLDTSSSAHIRRSVVAVWMLTVRAFNAWMQGRPVKTLKYEAGDAPPAIDLTGASRSERRPG